ncbi:MAG: uroporphyrinogen decarboxylase, partial [Clostridia bacterium]
MTKRERVISALNHIETDIVPYNADFTEQAWENIQNFTHNPHLLEDYGTHLHYGQYWNYPTELPDRPNFFMD